MVGGETRRSWRVRETAAQVGWELMGVDMRIETTTRELFKFSELSKEAQEAAISKLHTLNVDHDWWQGSEEAAKECGEKMGIQIKNLYFSGFWSQGDGASWEGRYEYAKGGARAVTKEYPQDKGMQQIARELQDIQKRNGYRLYAVVEKRGHYEHSGCMSVTVYDRKDDEPVDEKTDEEVTRLLRDFANRVYRWLECEYGELTTPESIKDTIEANEYEFTADGARA